MISLTFDDGLDVHLDHGVRLLDDCGLAGTFYVPIGSTCLTGRWREWQEAAWRGHELGNHTIFHPADIRKSWVTVGNAIDLYNLDRMRQELQVASRVLSMVDGCIERTFAYPCSTCTLGRHGLVRRFIRQIGMERTRVAGWLDHWGWDLGSTRADYGTLMADLFLAARGGGLTLADSTPPVRRFDRYHLLSAAIDGHPLADLQAFTERGLAARGWVILQFHGIGGGHRMDCDLVVFRDFVHWIADSHSNKVVTIREGAKGLWDGSRDSSADGPV